MAHEEYVNYGLFEVLFANSRGLTREQGSCHRTPTQTRSRGRVAHVQNTPRLLFSSSRYVVSAEMSPYVCAAQVLDQWPQGI